MGITLDLRRGMSTRARFGDDRRSIIGACAYRELNPSPVGERGGGQFALLAGKANPIG